MIRIVARASALLLLLVAGSAIAQPARPWVAASASFNHYALDAIDEDVEASGLFAPGTLDDIHSSFGFGAAAGLDVLRWRVGVAYERLPATAETEQLGGLEYDLAADAFLARVGFVVARAPRLDVGVGVGGGIASVSGHSETGGGTLARSAPGADATDAVILGPRFEASGSSACFEGFVEGTAKLGARWSLAPAVGYRRAKIEGRRTGSEGAADGTFDFSGWHARLALRLSLL
jgi:hypothetical protein